MGIVVCIVLILCILYLFMIMPRLAKRKELLPFLGSEWAHRGLHCVEKGIPENSMKAFKAAVKAGVGIELDVHLTKDGQLVVFHDDTLERMCRRKGKIEEMTYEELSSCYLSGTSERIPLFTSVLDYVNGRVPILIEVKLPNEKMEICVQLAEQLKDYGGSYLVQSFNSLVLRWLEKHSPHILRGQLSSNLTKSDKTPHYLLRWCTQYLLCNCLGRPDFISYKLADSSNKSLFVLHRIFATPVAVWTIRDKSSMELAKKKYEMYIFERI